MTRFIQLHVLTFYPPSNLNRDDTGKPKNCNVGGRERLRISSQCLKRAWRTSDVFAEALGEHTGTRSKRVVADHFHQILSEHGIKEKDALAWTASVIKCFGSPDKKNPLNTGQLVHYTPAEIKALQALARTLAQAKRAPSDDELNSLRGQGRAVDIAMFGRMLAEHPKDNMDAAIQVSHAFTVNDVAVEEDYFTAVDDLNTREDTGAGHLDETGFGSGVFYLYICVNHDQLLENLNGDQALVDRALAALTQAVATVSPSGKQNSFAAQSPAAYILAEKSDSAPRSLALSFRNAIRGGDHLDLARKQLEDTRKNLNKAYGETLAAYTFFPLEGTGTLAELTQFVQEAQA